VAKPDRFKKSLPPHFCSVQNGFSSFYLIYEVCRLLQSSHGVCQDHVSLIWEHMINMGKFEFDL